MIGDGHRLQRVLINLVKNALKYTLAGQQVKIKVCYQNNEGRLIVRVEDTGYGIAREDLPKLFSRAVNLHRTSLINSNGVGIGLMIVKLIVESTNG